MRILANSLMRSNPTVEVTRDPKEALLAKPLRLSGALMMLMKSQMKGKNLLDKQGTNIGWHNQQQELHSLDAVFEHLKCDVDHQTFVFVNGHNILQEAKEHDKAIAADNLQQHKFSQLHQIFTRNDQLSAEIRGAIDVSKFKPCPTD